MDAQSPMAVVANDDKPTPIVVTIALSNGTHQIKSETKCEQQSTRELAQTAIAVGTGCTGGVGLGKGGKGERKLCVNFDEKVKFEPEVKVTELLGSVTTHNCPGTRTSARVIQKMKQDQTRPLTPPPNEREPRKDDKTEKQKTPSQIRAIKPSWTNIERNHFFDALNEFGKDFEGIGSYINSKLKRKSTTDVAFKTKDQVRQHYYQTYHKIGKYVKFSDEIKKPAQELYALINYGEMRRKLQFVTDKHFMKLKNLVYHGHITVRCKGKNIRIKTPSVKALRRLNQLDDSLEDIRLPSKIEVIVGPATMESFGRVQTIAQNPRARTTVPLHKKLVNFIKAFQYKWRSPEMRLAEEAAKLFPGHGTEQPTTAVPSESSEKPAYSDAEICFMPRPGVTIHRPLLSITEYLSSVNICLTAYEERMGVKVRGESLSLERTVNGKRQRSDSGSEKLSPETKKHKQLTSLTAQDKSKTESGADSTLLVREETDALLPKSESSGDELTDELNELLAETDYVAAKDELQSAFGADTTTATSTKSTDTLVAVATSSTQSLASAGNAPRAKRGANAKSARNSLTFKPLISDDVMRRIRQGWTASNAADITIGDLYVVLGQDSRLELDYYWTDASPPETAETSISASAVFPQKQNGMPYNPNECDDPQLLHSLATSTVGNKLKHLLLIANLSERMRKRQCSCGHTCERNAAKSRFERDLAAKTFVSNKTFSNASAMVEANGLFRQPMAPMRRAGFNMDPVKQLNTLSRQKMSRPLVQRLLLPGGANHAYDLLDMTHMQNTLAAEKQQSGAESTAAKPAMEENPCTTTCDPSFTTATATRTTNANAVSSSAGSDSDKCTWSASDISCFAGTADQASTLFALKDYFDDSAAAPSSSSDASLSSNNTEPAKGLPLAPPQPDSAFDDFSNLSLFTGAMSPMHLLRESTSNSRWLEENINDYSLSSLLGHLDGINTTRDILDPSSNLSVISESSVDYMHRFQEIKAFMQSQENKD